MNAARAYASLATFGRPVLTTDDAAVRLDLATSAASKLLARLAQAGLVLRIRRGLWSTVLDLDPMLLPEHLSAPYPSYVSLLTALSIHGMIEQIPRRIFAVSLGPTRRITTTRGVFSMHHIAPELFGGFETDQRNGLKLATPEKALFDVLYLSRGRGGLFSRLPELELPRRFDLAATRRWVKRLPPGSHRTMVASRLETALEGAARA